jgi:hypothetical protein
MMYLHDKDLLIVQETKAKSLNDYIYIYIYQLKKYCNHLRFVLAIMETFQHFR